MSAELPLTRTKLFWLAVLFPIGLYFVLSVIIWFADDQFCSWDLSAQGFNNYLWIYRLPLGILASIVPLVAVVASNHRSEQAAATLLAQYSQNNFSNYYTHIAELEKFIENKKVDKSAIKFVDVRHAHDRLFPDARDGKYSLNENLLPQLIRADEAIGKFIVYIAQTDFSQFKMEALVIDPSQINEAAALRNLLDMQGDLVRDLRDMAFLICETAKFNDLPQLEQALHRILHVARHKAEILSLVCEFDISERAAKYTAMFRSISNGIQLAQSAAKAKNYKMDHPLDGISLWGTRAEALFVGG